MIPACITIPHQTPGAIPCINQLTIERKRCHRCDLPHRIARRRARFRGVQEKIVRTFSCFNIELETVTEARGGQAKLDTAKAAHTMSRAAETAMHLVVTASSASHDQQMTIAATHTLDHQRQ
jgi:hypothetical protein